MNSLAKPAAWEKLFWPLLAAGLLLALWHYSVLWTATKVFPSPLSVEKGLAQLLHRHVLWADIGDSPSLRDHHDMRLELLEDGEWRLRPVRDALCA